ncbi:MAG: hypothetical protein ACTSQ5_06390 [Promethearchaeota archaeon]
MCPDEELQNIRRKKMQEMLNKKKQAEQRSQRVEMPIDKKMDQILAVLLAPNANQYLSIIKERNYELYIKIRQKIFPPKIMPELDLLLQYIEVQQIERQVLGIGSTLTIKKQGHNATSLSNFLKDDED